MHAYLIAGAPHGDVRQEHGVGWCVWHLPTFRIRLGVAVVCAVFAWRQIEIAALQVAGLGTIQEREVRPIRD